MIAKGDGWELRRGDCLDPETGLPSVDAVDHVITDPPFSAGVYKRMRTNGSRLGGVIVNGDGRRVSKSVLLRRQKAIAELGEKRIGTAEEAMQLMPAIASAVRRWVLLFSDLEIAHAWKGIGEDVGLKFVRTGLWVKTNPTPQISGDRPGSGAEAIVILHPPGRTKWNGGGHKGVWTHATISAERRQLGHLDHPCPKPLGLMEKLILDFTDPGDLVCDPFAGSGTTGIACRKHGRRFLGWERDPEFFDLACRRLESRPPKVEGQAELFG